MRGSGVINSYVDGAILNVPMQNSRLGRPLRLCHMRLVKSRKYCFNLNGIRVTWCIYSVASHSTMSKE